MSTAAEMVAEARSEVEQITPQDATAEAYAQHVVFLDVREPVEWEHHIEGAVQVPRGLLEFRADPAAAQHIAELDPATRIIVYCRSGGRGALAAAALKQLGFENVANLAGGFKAWKAAGLPTSEHHADF